MKTLSEKEELELLNKVLMQGYYFKKTNDGNVKKVFVDAIIKNHYIGPKFFIAELFENFDDEVYENFDENINDGLSPVLNAVGVDTYKNDWFCNEKDILKNQILKSEEEICSGMVLKNLKTNEIIQVIENDDENIGGFVCLNFGSPYEKTFKFEKDRYMILEV